MIVQTVTKLGIARQKQKVLEKQLEAIKKEISVMEQEEEK